jgi:hypothetical protein
VELIGDFIVMPKHKSAPTELNYLAINAAGMVLSRTKTQSQTDLGIGGGAAQTPWTSNIDGNFHSLGQVTNIGVGITAVGTVGLYVYRPSGGVTYPIYLYSTSLNGYGVTHNESDAGAFAGFAGVNNAGNLAAFVIYGSSSSSGPNTTAILAPVDFMITIAGVQRLRLDSSGQLALFAVGSTAPAAGSNIVYRDSGGFLKIA